MIMYQIISDDKNVENPRKLWMSGKVFLLIFVLVYLYKKSRRNKENYTLEIYTVHTSTVRFPIQWWGTGEEEMGGGEPYNERGDRVRRLKRFSMSKHKPFSPPNVPSKCSLKMFHHKKFPPTKKILYKIFSSAKCHRNYWMNNYSF